SRHHSRSGLAIAEAEVDSLVSYFLVGGIRTDITPESNLQKTYVPQWSVTNGSRLDDGHVYYEMVDEFAPPNFFASVRTRAEYNVKERRRPKSVVEKKDELLKARDEEIKNLKAQMLLKEAEATEAIQHNTILEKEQNALDVKETDLEALVMDNERELTNLNVHLAAVKSQKDILVDQVHELEVSSAGLQEKLSSYESLTERVDEFQDAQLKIVNDKFDKLHADFVKMALHLEEKFYPHLLTTIFCCRWLLTHGMELALINYMHSPAYLYALGVAVGKAIEKGLTELQPYVDQLMVPIHHSPDKVAVGASALSFALDVSRIRIQKIRENITNHRSTLRDVFVPLAEPFSVVVLMGSEDSSHHSGLTIAEAEVDSLVRSSAPIMTTATIVTSMVDSSLVAKEKTYNVKERRRPKSVVEKKDELLKARDEEIENLKAQMLLKEAEAAEAIQHNTILEKEQNALDVKETDLEALVMDNKRELTNLNVQLAAVKSQKDILVDQVHELEVSSAGLQEKLSSYESLTERVDEFQDAHLKIVNDKFDKLHADFVKMALHLEEKFYLHLLTTIFCCRWFLTHGMELALINYMHSPAYLYALGVAVGKAIEKGMQDGLSAGIIHGKEGSIETVMDIIRLENPLTEKLGLTELQPYVDQLMVLIHHSLDKVAVGASALSFALDVSRICIQKIRENITNHRSTLRDVFVPLAEPFSVVVLMGSEGTSNVMPTTADTTTALSGTLASATIIAPISVDDYEVIGTDDQAGADGNADPF
nr:hypothetical protein [Tanacetum cinerariifolium]